MSFVYIKTGNFPHLFGTSNQATTLLLHYAIHEYNGAYLLTHWVLVKISLLLTDPL
jgi:hypothetical protein